MKKMFGIEVDEFIEELNDFKMFIIEETQCAEIIGSVYLYHLEQDAVQAKEIFTEADLYIDFHKLINSETGRNGECYYDYSLQSSPGKHYFFAELLEGFVISKGEQDSISMFKLQLEEHLVFQSSWQNKDVFLIDGKLKELIQGLSKAYDIEVSFLDLDKL
ncbi:hypothetical protein [Bacillus dakarensis]|uniref:hypothetical protein n=1 Tax=Robertmurraya dakarensis TaxID=1926278 RepID=UPI0009823320|nr:hypothetical protein [Bacillus dakarensis]